MGKTVPGGEGRGEGELSDNQSVMSTLTLIRHGQASFFAANYDQLSALGERQMQVLGGYWARRELRFDEVYTGPRVRQRRSAEIAIAACRQAGVACPEPMLLEELDEYDLKGLTQVLAPQLCLQNPEFAQVVKRHLRSEAEERMANFQAMFEPLLHFWQSGKAGDLQMESWAAFRARVQRGIRLLQECGGNGRRAAYFTSGGFIGTSVMLALAAPDRAALELHWRLRNGSLTEFAFTRDRFTLDTFNTVPHLTDPGLLTHR